MTTESVRKLVHLAEHIILLVVMLATLIAVAQEIWAVIERREVRLSDLLLMFLYLEVIAMIGIYYEEHKLPVRYPIYIAIVALARYIILESKSLDSVSILGLSGAILIMTIAVFIVRYGHVKFPWRGEDD